MRQLRTFVLGAAALVWAAGAAAQDDRLGPRSGVSFGPRAMYFIPDGADADSGDLYGGAQLRLHLGPVIAVEGSADYRRQRFGPGRTTRVDVFPVQASLLAYLIPRSPLTPYLIAGGGW